jgi:hypothetical protein
MRWGPPGRAGGDFYVRRGEGPGVDDTSVARVRQARVALVHLGVGIALLEVDEMVFTGYPGRHGVLISLTWGVKPSCWMKRRSGSE